MRKALVLLTLGFLPVAAARAQDIAGDWHGTLDTG